MPPYTNHQLFRLYKHHNIQYAHQISYRLNLKTAPPANRRFQMLNIDGKCDDLGVN